MARMGRPRKDKSLLLRLPLRIMLTADQKELIERAAKIERQEISAWLRPIIVRAAQEVVASEERRRQKLK
jgi:uncharacterized protein (DUF1778 family)